MKLEEISSVVAHDCYGFPNHVVRNYIINLKNGDYFVSDIRSILKDDTKEIIINDIKRVINFILFFIYLGLIILPIR